MIAAAFIMAACNDAERHDDEQHRGERELHALAPPFIEDHAPPPYPPPPRPSCSPPPTAAARRPAPAAPSTASPTGVKHRAFTRTLHVHLPVSEPDQPLLRSGPACGSSVLRSTSLRPHGRAVDLDRAGNALAGKPGSLPKRRRQEPHASSGALVPLRDALSRIAAGGLGRDIRFHTQIRRPSDIRNGAQQAHQQGQRHHERDGARPIDPNAAADRPGARARLPAARRAARHALEHARDRAAGGRDRRVDLRLQEHKRRPQAHGEAQAR